MQATDIIELIAVWAVFSPAAIAGAVYATRWIARTLPMDGE